MVARLQQYKDDEYRNDDLISCVKSDLAQCAPKFKLQLDRLTDRPEMLVAIQHILKFMCQGRAGSRLAVCVPDAAVSTPRGQVLQRLKRHKYDVILDRAKKAMFF